MDEDPLDLRTDSAAPRPGMDSALTSLFRKAHKTILAFIALHKLGHKPKTCQLNQFPKYTFLIKYLL